MPPRIHTVSYVRLATKARDGANGLLYIHRWPTGHQSLVFSKVADANTFEARLNKAAAAKGDAR